MNENGQRYDGNQVPEQFVKHFQKFLGTASVVQSIEDRDDIFTNVLSNNVTEDMIKDVCESKIKEAMFAIADVKALGPDGFTACFFK